MRCIGKGAESAVMFCGIMNLPPPPTKFTKFNNILLQAARETCEESMAEAVHEAVEENEGGRDIAVAVDGSWQKRGFSSKNGVVTVTSVDTDPTTDESKRRGTCVSEVLQDSHELPTLKGKRGLIVREGNAGGRFNCTPF
ncbi:uncharacterized protein NPIL_76721 [Nephila pilipes]|uniref:Mutator-like transposase domain-containing protein n=1 Tax=Nephila pilipes TaxID=299642 RepID=A0A8X6I2N4_NEPPI|nr:uncharacterized protein NPIL_76721 [Nephila pilipes]